MDRNSSRNTVSSTQRAVAAECLRRLRSRSSVQGFGYKIQALAAHVLLGLNHRVTAVNATRHPDVVTVKGGREFRFEVEAEVIGVKKTLLTSADFGGLLRPGVSGFFALAVSFPRPFWVLVPAQSLERRDRPAGHALLKALSDKAFSATWTHEYVSLLGRSCRDVLDRSFDQLVQRAIDGRAL